MGLIINRQKYAVYRKGGEIIASTNFQENPKVRLANVSYRKRGVSWVRGIVMHTRMGQWPIIVKPGGTNRKWDEVVADRWAHGGRMAGAHIAIDGDGSYACMADCLTEATYHAGQVNEVTVGIEMYQEVDGTMYESTLDSALWILDALTRILGIQRQFCIERNLCRRFARPIQSGVNRSVDLAYMEGGAEGKDFVGIYGHRNCTRNRGPGDPGDPLWEKLEQAGYESFQVEKMEDRITWKERQHSIGMHEEDCDGIPGKVTVDALRKEGHKNGLWVPRAQD